MTKRLLPIILAGIAAGFSSFTYANGITLEQAIREVCTKSDSVKMMRESVIKSDQMVREKWSNALPVLSATAYGGKNHGSLFSSGGGSSGASRSMSESPSAAATPDAGQYVTWQDLNNLFSNLSNPMTSTIYTAGLSLTQPIFTFGKVGTAIKIAKQFNQSAHCSYARNMQTLELQAIDAFYHAVLAEKAGEIAERSLARKKELNEFLQRNFELGSGSKALVLSTRADVLNQSSVTLIAKRDAYTARMYLNAFMGRSLTDSTALDTTDALPNFTSTALPNQNEAIVTALAERTDLKSLQLLAESNKGGAKIFRAMYLPSIAAAGSFNYSKIESGSAFMPTNGTTSWSAGIGIQWTLFDGFANSARAAQYASDAEKLDIAHRTAEKFVEIEVRSAIAECVAADSNSAASQEMFSAALEGYNLTNNNFKQGSGQLADLQRVDELLQLAELGLTNARYRQLRSHAALLVAMGKDIVTITEEKP